MVAVLIDGLGGRVDVLEHEPGDLVRAFDERPVANLVQHDLTHHAAVRPTAFEDRTCLLNHGLGREDLGSRPTRYRARHPGSIALGAGARGRRRRSCCTRPVKKRC